MASWRGEWLVGSAAAGSTSAMSKCSMPAIRTHGTPRRRAWLQWGDPWRMVSAVLTCLCGVRASAYSAPYRAPLLLHHTSSTAALKCACCRGLHPLYCRQSLFLCKLPCSLLAVCCCNQARLLIQCTSGTAFSVYLCTDLSMWAVHCWKLCIHCTRVVWKGRGGSASQEAQFTLFMLGMS